MQDDAKDRDRLSRVSPAVTARPGRAPFPSAWSEIVAAAALPRTPSLAPAKLDYSVPSRCEILVKIGAGGTASVYVGRSTGALGFTRLFAIKRAHPHLLDEPSAQRMLVTEARLASRIHHANVVAVHDVEQRDGTVLLVMDYVEGASLSELVLAAHKEGQEVPYPIAVRVILDACAGLSAIHELTDDSGGPLGFVHGDVSPQNLLVGIDGTTRIADFGLARLISAGRATGALNGKLAYVAPELIEDQPSSVRSDLFAMGVVLWEALARQRLFRGAGDVDTVHRLGLFEPPPLSRVAVALGDLFDEPVAKALEKYPSRRYGSVREFAAAIERVAAQCGLIATNAEVGRFAQAMVGQAIERRRRLIGQLNRSSTDVTPVRPRPCVILEADAFDDSEQTRRHARSSLPSFPLDLDEPLATSQATQSVQHYPVELQQEEERTGVIELTKPQQPKAALARTAMLAAPVDAWGEDLSPVPAFSGLSASRFETIRPTTLVSSPTASSAPSAASATWIRVGLAVAAALGLVAFFRGSLIADGPADLGAEQALAPALEIVSSAVPAAVLSAVAATPVETARVLAPAASVHEKRAPRATKLPSTPVEPRAQEPEEPATTAAPAPAPAPEEPEAEAPPVNVDPLSRARRRAP